MAKDIVVELADRPGTVAAAAEALGKAGVNIEGIGGFNVGGKGIAHILVEDAAAARRALEAAGARVTGERDVVVVEIANRPGELGKLTRRIAEAGVNLDAVYLATNTRVVLCGDKIDKIKEAARSAGRPA